MAATHAHSFEFAYSGKWKNLNARYQHPKALAASFEFVFLNKSDDFLNR